MPLTDSTCTFTPNRLFIWFLASTMTFLLREAAICGGNELDVHLALRDRAGRTGTNSRVRVVNAFHLLQAGGEAQRLLARILDARAFRRLERDGELALIVWRHKPAANEREEGK